MVFFPSARLTALLTSTGLFLLHLSLSQWPVVAHSGHSETFKSSGSSPSIVVDTATAQQLGIKTEVITARLLAVSLKATGVIEMAPNRQALVTAPVRGKLVALMVEPGSSVQAGQPIATLTSAELTDLRVTAQEKRAELGATVQQAQTNLQLAQANYQRYRIIAAAEINRARDSLTAAQAQFERDKTLVRDQSVVRAARDKYQRQLTIAKTDIELARTELAVAQERYSQDQRLANGGALPRRQVLDSRAQWLAAQSKLAKAQQQIEVITADTELRKAETELPFRSQQESAAKLAEARASLTTASTQKDVAAATAELERSQAALTAAKTKLDLVDRHYLLRLKQLGLSANEQGVVTITAPINGTVTARPATVGQTVVEGETQIMTLGNDRQVVATANLYEGDLAKVAVGQTVYARVASGQVLTGTVSRIGTGVGEKRTVPVQTLLDNTDGQLKAGMFAELEVATGNSASAVLSVPSSALVEANGKKLLYVQSGDTFQAIEVKTGRTTAERLEITQGLFAGDRVVTQNALSLYAQSLRGDHPESPAAQQSAASNTAALPIGLWPVASGAVALSLGALFFRRRRGASSASTQDLNAEIDRVITATLLESEEPAQPQLPDSLALDDQPAQPIAESSTSQL